MVKNTQISPGPNSAALNQTTRATDSRESQSQNRAAGQAGGDKEKDHRMYCDFVDGIRMGRDFLAFLRNIHEAGLSLRATAHGLEVKDGPYVLSPEPYARLIASVMEWRFWPGVNFTPGTLEHTYLFLRLRWVRKSGFKQDLNPSVLGLLAQAIPMYRARYLGKIVDVAFRKFYRPDQAVQREKYFVNALAAVAGIQRRRA